MYSVHPSCPHHLYAELTTNFYDPIEHLKSGDASRGVGVDVVNEFIVVVLGVKVESEFHKVGTLAQVAQSRQGYRSAGRGHTIYAGCV